MSIRHQWKSLGKEFAYLSKLRVTAEDADNVYAIMNFVVSDAIRRKEKFVIEQRKRCRTSSDFRSLSDVEAELSGETRVLSDAMYWLGGECENAEHNTKTSILQAFVAGLTATTLLIRTKEHLIAVGHTMSQKAESLKISRKETKWTISRDKLLALCVKHFTKGCNQKELCRRIASEVRTVGGETVRKALVTHKIRAAEYKK